LVRLAKRFEEERQSESLGTLQRLFDSWITGPSSTVGGIGSQKCNKIRLPLHPDERKLSGVEVAVM